MDSSNLPVILIIVAAVVILALAGAVVVLIRQKRSIEQSAADRADQLVAESMRRTLSVHTNVDDEESADSDQREAA